MRRNIFSQMMVNLWNSLARTAVEAKLLDTFKGEASMFLISQGVKDYEKWNSAPMSYGLTVTNGFTFTVSNNSRETFLRTFSCSVRNPRILKNIY